MSEESFIREVDEELRSDQVRKFWDRYKWLVIGVAVSIIALTAGYNFWKSYSESVAGASGDRFLAAVALSADGKHEEAITELEALGKDGAGEYPALARIRLAAEYARQGAVDQAVEAFDEISSDNGFDETLRQVAQLRAGLLLVDHGDYDEVAKRLEPLAAIGESFRHSAREGLGLSAWKQGDLQKAHRWFTEIAQDILAPGGIRTRAGVMLDLLSGKGITASEES